MNQQGYRTEKDSMGELQVPADALWGAQTQRAVDNFGISGQAMPRRFIQALGLVKASTAEANRDLGDMESDVAGAIVTAAEAVASGAHDDHFPVDVFQTGSGTSSNMNANEVIARLATAALGRPVHPNDHVNMSQSSNDVIPTTIHVAAAVACAEDLLPALDYLAQTLEARAAELDGITTTGRTHLMDAMPVTLGQEVGGWAQQIRLGGHRGLYAEQVHVAERAMDGIHPRHLLGVSGRGDVAEEIVVGDKCRGHGARETPSGGIAQGPFIPSLNARRDRHRWAPPLPVAPPARMPRRPRDAVGITSRLGSVRGQHVAGTPDRLKIARLLGVVFQLAAQPGDLHVHRTFLRLSAASAQPHDQVGPADRRPWLTREYLQQLALGCGQPHQVLAAPHLAALQIIS